MKKDLEKGLDSMHKRYMNGEVSRRDFLKYLGIAGAAAGLVGGPFGLLTRSASAADSIRFDGWGGSTSEAFRKYAFDPFTKATGVKVIDGEFGDMDTYLTRVKASFPPGGEFNLAHLSGVFDYARYVGLGYDCVLDESKISNLKNVMSAMMEPYRAITKGKLSAVPYDYGQTGIAYNTKHISKEKAEKLGASLLWDKDLDGKLGSWGDWRTNIWYAALYTDQHPNNIKDMKAVWDALRKQRIAALQAQGHPIGFLSPNNCYSWQECIFVIKGSDLDVAQKLLDFMLAPEASIAVADGQKYPPSLDPTKVPMPDSIKKLPAFDPTGKLKGYLFADPAYWNGHQVEWAEEWDRVMAGR